jgi:threonylcarbamoyladenosine tRNA methylthiotransferase MtaB
MEESLLARGFSLVAWGEPAGVRVVNTCTVTAKTDRECRREITRAARLDPSSLLVVTGCYAQVAPDRVSAIPGVALVLGNEDKLRLAEHLERLLAERLAPEPGGGGEPGAAPAADRHRAPACVTAYEGESPGFPDQLLHHFTGYTRAFLKVQTGCDGGCSYCTIPAARGPARSMRLAAVGSQIRLLAEEGYREVVLTGVDLGAWGRDTGEGSLADLLSALVDLDPDLCFRLSSTEPMEVDERVLSVIGGAGERFAHHLHLPLQSGSDGVLRRMNRPYRAHAYAERVQAIRRALPDAAIGADVIVGFPGETEDEFEETMALVAGTSLTYLHVFAYSDRPGTRAWELKPKVRPEVIAERSLRLRRLGARKDADFQDRFKEAELTALVLRERDPAGLLVALTGNYMHVLLPGPDALMNSLVRVRLLRRRADGRWEGEVV